MNFYGNVTEKQLLDAFHKASMVIDGKLDIDKFNEVWDKVQSKLSYPVGK